MTSSWMIVAGFLFATMAVLVKLGADQFDAAELGLYRSLAGLLFVLGLVRVNGGTLRSRYMGQHMVRGFVGAVSLIGYFYSIAQLPLATAQTLNYTSPLFLAIATIVVMGEAFRRGCWWRSCSGSPAWPSCCSPPSSMARRRQR
jgi:drug/metabolite transporter (DMT)-like permease